MQFVNCDLVLEVETSGIGSRPWRLEFVFSFDKAIKYVFALINWCGDERSCRRG